MVMKEMIVQLIKNLLSKTLYKESGLYTIINAIASIFPLIALPIITRFVPPSDYGIYAIFLVGVNLLMPLVGIGMETASGRKYIEKEKIDYASYISTAVSLTVILSLVIYFILIFLEPFLSNYIPITRDWFIAWICVAWAQTISGLVLVIQQMGHKPLGFGLWRIGRSFIINGLLIIFILASYSSWQNLITVSVISNGIICILSIFWLRHKQLIKIRFSITHLKNLLSYGGALIPHMLAAAIITATDRIILVNLINESAAGLYTVGYQAGQIMFLFSQSVNRAWTPWLYSKLNEKTESASREASINYLNLSLVFFLVGLVFCVIGFIALPWLFGNIYESAIGVFLWIVIAFFAQALWSITSSYLYFSGDTIWISASSIGAAILNIGLSYILVTMNGLIGAAQGTCLAYSLAFLIITIVAYKKSISPLNTLFK